MTQGVTLWPIQYGQLTNFPHIHGTNSATNNDFLLSIEETTSSMQNVIETYQIQLGIENDLLQNSISEPSYTNSAWLQQLKIAMNKFNIIIFRKNSM